MRAQVSFGSQLQYVPQVSLAHTAPDRIPNVKKHHPGMGKHRIDFEPGHELELNLCL